MTATDLYMHEIARRKIAEASGKYNLRTLLAMHMCHLPRHQEMVRILYKHIEVIAKAEPIDDAERMAEMIDVAREAMNKV